MGGYNISRNFIRKTRAKLGLTQAQLAERLGKGKRTIIRYENGDTPLPQSVVMALQALKEKAKHDRRETT